MMSAHGAFIFVCGALAGGLATSIVMKRHYENKYRKEVTEKADKKVAEMEEYVDRVREAYASKYYSEEESKPAKEPPKKPEVKKVDYTSFYSQNEEALKALLTQGTKEVSQDWVDPVNREHPEDDKPEEDEVKVSVTRSEKKPCEVITSWDWDSIEGYDRTELVFFTGDGVLCTDDNFEVIEDPEALVDDLLEDWAGTTEEELYVRNYRRQTLYLIRKEYADYY